MSLNDASSNSTVKKLHCVDGKNKENFQKPSREQAEEAVRTLIRWAGDNPEREGLRNTPPRVARAYEEFFSGYGMDPAVILGTVFEETHDYDDMVLLRDIEFESYCEHHMVPILGKVHIGYWPDQQVVGISKLARIVDVYAKRLQLQEKMTSQIADAIYTHLKARGVGVIIESAHQCMTTRGVHKQGAKMLTSTLKGNFKDNPEIRHSFFALSGFGSLV